MAQQLPMRTVWRYALATILNIPPYAMLIPLVVVRLSEAGASATAVGLYALLPFAVILLMMPVAARLYATFGAALAYRSGLAASSLAIVGTVFAGDYRLLCLCNALVGFGTSLLWTGTESLIARNAPEDRVGRVTGLYQAGLGVGFAGGPFIAPLFDLGFAQAGAVAIGVMGLAWLPVIGLPWRRTRLPTDGSPPSLGRVLRLAPLLAVVACAGGLFELGLNAAAPVQALALGLTHEQAVMVVGVIAAGSLLFQVPVGWLADRTGPTAVTGVALTLLLVTSLGLLAAGRYPVLIWPLAFVWGAAGGALYTLTMIEVGRSHRSQHTTAVAAGIIAAFTLGAVIGPALAGAAIDLAPERGLALLLAAAAGVTGSFVIMLRRRQSP